MRSDEIADAITHLPGEIFERFAVAIVRRTQFPSLVPTSDSGDLGEDAKTEITTLQQNDGKWISLAASKTATYGKLEKDCKRCKSTMRRIDVLVFVIDGNPTELTIAKWKEKVRKEYGWELEVRSRKALVELASEDRCTSLVDEFLRIPPLGGDHTHQVETAVSIYTKRSLQELPVLAGMAKTIEREETNKIEEQLGLSKIIAVIGDAGAGKSVIAQILTRRALERQQPILFVNAQNIASKTTEIDLRSVFGLRGNIAEGLDRWGRSIGSPCIVIVDQLDSLGESASSNLLIDFIRDCKAYPNICIIIFARAKESIETRLLQKLIEIGATKALSEINLVSL